MKLFCVSIIRRKEKYVYKIDTSDRERSCATFEEREKDNERSDATKT